MNPLLLVLLAVGVLTVPVPFALRWWRQHQARQAWLALAPRLELTLAAGGGPRLLAGRYQGHSVEVLLSPDGMAQMRMKARARLPPGLHLSRQQAGVRRLQLRGRRDIQVGDEALDSALLIQGNNPAAVIRLLREPDVRDALLALVAGHPRAVLTGDELVAPMDEPVQEEPCRRALQALARVASTLERAAGQQAQWAASAREQARSEHPAMAKARPRAAPARSRVDRAAESSLDIQDEYARRTGLYRLVGQYPLLAGWLTLMFSGRKGLFGPTETPWGMVGLGLVLGGMAGAFYGGRNLLRCPACDESLMRRMGSRPNRHARALSLAACPSCNTRLR